MTHSHLQAKEKNPEFSPTFFYNKQCLSKNGIKNFRVGTDNKFVGFMETQVFYLASVAKEISTNTQRSWNIKSVNKC
jgi:hypothetical protein